MENKKNRNNEIFKIGIISIITNVVMAVIKGIIGLATASIAITLDGVNNLSSAIFGFVSVIEAKISGKSPDKKHPLGYGRIEYITAMLIAGVIFYTGITSGIESIKKIIHPEKSEYDLLVILVLGAFLIIKLFISKKIKKDGERLESMSLVAIGKYAGFEEVLSFSVLLSIIIYIKTGIQLEAYIGILISIFIIKTGISMIIDTIDEILGKRVDSSLSSEIKKDITEDEDVLGAFDLIINSYGPNTKIGSVHIEVKDSLTASEIDIISRRIGYKIYIKYGIILTGIGIYARDTSDKCIETVKLDIEKIVFSYKEVMQMHGFHMNKDKKIIIFDIIIDFTIKNRKEIYEEILHKIKEKYSEYEVYINLDLDI